MSHQTIDFVTNPYVSGGKMRKDVFARQFSVYVKLAIKLLDNDGVSTYSSVCTRLVGKRSTVSAAIAMVDKFLGKCDKAVLEKIACRYLELEDEIVSVFAKDICIYDRENRLVMGGVVHWVSKNPLLKRTSTEREGYTMKWVKPVTSEADKLNVSNSIKALSSEASFESGWDNFSTANALRAAAKRERWKLAPSHIVRTPYFAQELDKMGIRTERQ